MKNVYQASRQSGPVIHRRLVLRAKSRLLVCFSALVLWCGAVYAKPDANTEPVASVLFVSGNANVTYAGLAPQPLVSKAAVFPGATLTSHSGHVQLRFNDGAFVALRPGTRLVIESYMVSEQHPEQTRIRFLLQEGVGRFVTGTAGRRHKAGFRVNTPLAAIGIRGTDFVVQAAADRMKTLVNAGEIVVAPLAAGCMADSYGPCQGAFSRALGSRDQAVFLDLKAGQDRPAVRSRQELPVDAPLLQSAPALPAESLHGGQRASTDPVATSPAAPSDSVSWGRWSQMAQAERELAGDELVGRQGDFALYRRAEDVSLPSAGEFRFVPVQTEAYALTPDGNRLLADILAPELTVNFAQQVFSTSLIWQYDDQRQAFKATGVVDHRGIMHADASRSTMEGFYGVLSGRGQSAAYIFQGKTQTDIQALGLVRWTRVDD